MDRVRKQGPDFRISATSVGPGFVNPTSDSGLIKVFAPCFRNQFSSTVVSKLTTGATTGLGSAGTFDHWI